MAVAVAVAKKRGRKRGSTSITRIPPIIPIMVSGTNRHMPNSCYEKTEQKTYMVLSKVEILTINTVTFLYSKDNVFIDDSLMNMISLTFEDICRINSRLSPFICLFTTTYSSTDTLGGATSASTSTTMEVVNEPPLEEVVPIRTTDYLSSSQTIYTNIITYTKTTYFTRLIHKLCDNKTLFNVGTITIDNGISSSCSKVSPNMSYTDFVSYTRSFPSLVNIGIANIKIEYVKRYLPHVIKLCKENKENIIKYHSIIMYNCYCIYKQKYNLNIFYKLCKIMKDKYKISDIPTDIYMLKYKSRNMLYERIWETITLNIDD